MNIKYLFYVSVLLFIGCNNSNKLDISLVSLSKGDSVKLVIDDKQLYEEVLDEDIEVEILQSPIVIENYSNGKDTIKIQVLLNQIDTTIYINPSQYKRIFIGEDIGNRILVLHTTVYGSSDFTID